MTLDPGGAAFESPEPFVIGDAGKAYGQTKWATPYAESMPSDTECDGFAVGDWHLRAASVRGLMHRQFAEPRQDSYAIRWSPGQDRLVLVVCDGVGSAPLSHHAACSVSNFLAEEVVDAGPLEDIPWWAIFETASHRVIDAANTAVSDDVRSTADARIHMATTATVVVLDGLQQPGPWKAVCASVGDTTAWISSASAEGAFGPWDEVGPAGRVEGEFAGSATAAIPMAQSDDVRVTSLVVDAAQLLTVTSDGVSDAFASGRGEVVITLGREWSTPPTPINFAAHVGYGRRTHTDDRTCVALWSPV